MHRIQLRTRVSLGPDFGGILSRFFNPISTIFGSSFSILIKSSFQWGFLIRIGPKICSKMYPQLRSWKPDSHRDLQIKKWTVVVERVLNMPQKCLKNGTQTHTRSQYGVFSDDFYCPVQAASLLQECVAVSTDHLILCCPAFDGIRRRTQLKFPAC